MKSKTFITLLLLIVGTTVNAQVYNEMDADGNITQRDEYGNNRNFNPNNRDSTKAKKEIPRGVWAWTVDRRFGDVKPAPLDTMPHLYQNSIYNTGLYGEYNTTGNNYTPRLSRIFIDRKATSEFFFTQPLDYTTREPDEFLFTRTLSPYTNISYDNCGDKQHGDDHLEGKFAINAGKRIGLGFDLDYHYARGYFQNQNNSNFRASLYGSYIGDRYQMHLLTSFYHRKHTESGGIIDDTFITHPEMKETQFSEEEIPTVLDDNWSRNDGQQIYLSHRYNIGFYRKVPMTEEEIKAKAFAAQSAKQKKQREEIGDGPKGDIQRNNDRMREEAPKPMGRPEGAKIAGMEPDRKKAGFEADTTRIKVDTDEKRDSLLAVKAREDSLEATMKKEYVPVTSFIHTLEVNNHNRIYQAYDSPIDYYLNTYYNTCYEGTYSGDSIYDKTQYLSIKNTFALALLEGFNKYMKAGLKGFVSYENRTYKMPSLNEGATQYYMNKWTEHSLHAGGQLSKTQGKTLHFNASADVGITGYDAGSLALDFDTDLNFRLFGDTVRLAASAFFHRSMPTFFQESYHSKHLWWDQDLEGETRTHIEGRFKYDKTNTLLRIAVDQIQNYTYFGMKYDYIESNRVGLTGGVYQEKGNISVLTAQLMQHVRLGILNWENVITYQNSSNKDVLPLPDLNLFSNLYLKFKIARVLSVEMGGSVTFFTKYDAPDYLPIIGQFAIQQNADSRVNIGGYPWVDVYVNMHLKRARFFIAMTHLNAGSGTKDYFLAPHYPTNSRVLHMGVSWNFYN